MNVQEETARIKEHGIRAAFTLLEAVIVITIVGVLSAVAVPRVSQSMNVHAAEAAAGRVAADLAFARENALSRGVHQSVTFDTSKNSYSLGGMTSRAKGGAGYVVDLTADPYRAVLSSATFGSPPSAEITFDAYGVPDNGGTVTIVVGAAVSRSIVVTARTGAVITNNFLLASAP